MSLTTVRAPGSCGELVQGIIGGKDFLITCPIDCYSEVTVKLDTEETVFRQDRLKASLAVQKTLQHFKQTDRKYHLSINSPLPIGKGMASSSADISAACLATAACLEKPISLQEIAEIALSIEPTDAVFFPGIMMFDHRSGKVCDFLGQPPELQMLVFDFGGEIDTLSFNARLDLQEKNLHKEKIVREALDLVKEGIKQQNTALIGKGATLSALANQTILPKPHLEEVIHLAERAGAVGVNVAHSGTIMAILVDPQASLSRANLVKEVCEKLPRITFLEYANLIGGGLEITARKGATDDK